MFGKKQYTWEQEQEWQRQDRTNGPLKNFQGNTPRKNCATKFGHGPITVEAGSSGEYFFKNNASITIRNDGLHPDGLLVYYDVFGLTDHCELQPNISTTGTQKIDATIWPMSKETKNISPGRSNANGFVLRVKVPPQSARNGNSARCYVTVEAN